MDYINKFKINGVIVDFKKSDIPTKNGCFFTLKSIIVEQEEELEGDGYRYIKKVRHEIQIDYEKNNLLTGDTVEITGFIKTNQSKDKTKYFTTLVATKCHVMHRPNVRCQAYNNNEQPEPNPCLSEGEDCPF